LGKINARRVRHRNADPSPFALAQAVRMASWLRGSRSCSQFDSELLDWLAVAWCADEVHGVNAGGAFGSFIPIPDIG